MIKFEVTPSKLYPTCPLITSRYECLYKKSGTLPRYFYTELLSGKIFVALSIHVTRTCLRDFFLSNLTRNDNAFAT